MFGLNNDELRIFRSLSSPAKIQDFLDAIPINFEKEGETLYSPRLVLRYWKAHCMEGALFASAVLKLHGEQALLLCLDTLPLDDAHVVALYKRGNHWGAISKTNHATVRFRDPIYRTPRELALSYFHEYTEPKGRKVLRKYSTPLNLARFGEAWITSEEPLWHIDRALDLVPYFPLVPKGSERHIRRADKMEHRAGDLVEWRRDDPRT